MRGIFAITLALVAAASRVDANCMSDTRLENIFKSRIAGATSLPVEGSCCQSDVCGIPCPAEHEAPHPGYLAAVSVSIVMSAVIGLGSYFWARGPAANFFVAGRTLSLPVVALTLVASAIDSNALLGNVDLAYKFQFWDGAVLPLGLGFSLFIHGFFIARHVRREEVLTLPEIYGRYYGPTVEVIVSVITIVSFIMLLAGNLVGMAKIIAYLGEIDYIGAVFLSGAILYTYTVTGGFFAIASTDMFQSFLGLLGTLVCAYYFISKPEWAAAPPSIGFPGYVYPDARGDGGACDLHKGVPCATDASLCCYNSPRWCPDGLGGDYCRTDNAAWPIGDVPIIYEGMADPYAYTPFPNAIYFNWSTILILGFGNVAALDFNARTMSSRDERTATLACFLAGAMTIFVGLPMSYVGATTRLFYGPDSSFAEFAADTCHKALGLPTCGLWVPDESAFLRLLTNTGITHPFVGGWMLVAIVAASMSTSSGAILAMATVASDNILRKVPSAKVTESNLVLFARMSGVPFTLAACFIASYAVQSTGYLLVVAFDIMLAGCVVPLFACFYVKSASPVAALASVLGGSILRLILEGALPKDRLLILPFPGDEFLDYGTPASEKLPAFLDVPLADQWDANTCAQRRLEDYTGVDSLAAPILSLILFFGVHWYEKHVHKKPLISAWWMQPVSKKATGAAATDAKAVAAAAPASAKAVASA